MLKTMSWSKFIFQELSPPTVSWSWEVQLPCLILTGTVFIFTLICWHKLNRNRWTQFAKTGIDYYRRRSPTRTHTPTHDKLIGLFHWHFCQRSQTAPRWFAFPLPVLPCHAEPSCARDGLSPGWRGVGGRWRKRAHSASKQVEVMSCDCGQTRENPLLPLN